jgi:hypothetical protein
MQTKYEWLVRFMLIPYRSGWPVFRSMGKQYSKKFVKTTLSRPVP